jgi:hypothetical protein
MRRLLHGTAGLLLTLPFLAQSQDTPKVEMSAGYAYLASNTIPGGASLHMNGGTGTLTFNLSSIVGVVADIGAYQQGNVRGTGSSLIVTTYLFGSRITLWKDRRFSLFGQALWGLRTC